MTAALAAEQMDPKVLALATKVKSYADPKAKDEQNYNTTMEVELTNGKIRGSKPLRSRPLLEH